MFENIDPLVFFIPLIAGFIGWFTNWLAVKATLYPVQFVGIPPVFGWQGVIPKNAEKMSLDFSAMIRNRLLDVHELVADIKNDEQQIDEMVDDLCKEVMLEFSTQIAPEAWAKAREKLRDYITELVRENIRNVLHSLVDRCADDADELIDIDTIMRDSMLDDRGLMGQVLFEIARPEFKFIEMSGLYFGFLFGVLQMFAWISYPVSWVLPAAGFLVGYITNWIALTFIFEPAEPIKIGPVTLQGLFIKRQAEAAMQFSDVVCTKVLNPDNFTTYLQREPARSKIKSLIEQQVDESMKIFEDDPMVALLVGADKLQEARLDLNQRIDNNEFESGVPIRELAGKTRTMRNQINRNLQALGSTEFNNVLRPVFKQDEWKLILAGGVIGVVIGVLQVVFLFGQSF